ncbi:MAG: CotH kinase family protein [Candidatus Sabulitectum sp.]|nr:CotH kinase family protein [Candidatus Sabulitectum sp.]
MDPILLDSLYSNPYADYQFPAFVETGYGACSCIAGFRGNTSLGYPKKSWKIELSDHSILNASLILLDAQYSDFTMMRNALGLYLTRRLGHPASQTQHVELYINDEYYGVYTCPDY